MRHLLFSALLGLASGTTYADVTPEELLATFVRCDEQFSQLLEANRSALGSGTAIEELKPDEFWFRADMSEGKEHYTRFATPLKLEGLELIAAHRADYSKSSFRGLYFREDFRQVFEALAGYPEIRRMRLMTVAGEHYASLRPVLIDGRQRRQLLILEQPRDLPFAAGSYLSCSLQ